MRRMLLCIFSAIILAFGMFLIPSYVSHEALAAPVSEVSAANEAPAVLRLLVLGRDRAANLTDSIFLLSVNQETKEARILQIPRDTYAAYTNRDYRKLNGAYATLGASGVKQFLSEALGVPIPYVLVLDLDCVASVVDAVGGVELDVPPQMANAEAGEEPSIRLEAGRRHLTGEEAEYFLRFRAGYATADLGRMDAQKMFLRAFAQKCRTLGTGAMLSLAWRLLPNVETDLPIGVAVSLIRILPQIDPEAVPMLTSPGAPVQGKSGAWYYSLNREGMLHAVNAYVFPQSPITDAEFDPMRVFDRQDMPEFHDIYTSPEALSAEATYHFIAERNRFYGRNDHTTKAVLDRRLSRGAGARRF